MGFNIAGLVINQNYGKDIIKLGKDLHWGIEVIEEIDFRTATSNWTPEGEFRLHFTDKATMIFFPHEWVVEQYQSQVADTLNYAYSATSMAFMVDLFRSGEMVRSIMEFNHEKKMQQGNPLELEKEHTTADGLTFALIDELLGDTFDSLIDLNGKSYRCIKTKVTDIASSKEKYTDISKTEVKEQKVQESIMQYRPANQSKAVKPTQNSSSLVNSNSGNKKWWQFWK